MKVCLAQIESIKGNVERNIVRHTSFIEEANKLHSDFIVFPELSITGYEPSLAEKFATSIHDPIFDSFQELSDKNDMCIGIGMPTKAEDGINISMLVFRPNQQGITYSKQLLHEDELPYFVHGSNSVFIEVKGKKIALGICYETLQRESFEQAQEDKVDLYVASVAKSEGGILKAEHHFPEMCREFGLPVLLVNSIGPCDDFVSSGQSTVWNESGEKLQQLDSKAEGLLVFDTVNNIATKKYL